MATDPSAESSSGESGLKYAVIGLVLLGGGALGIWAAMGAMGGEPKKKTEPEPAPAEDAGVEERGTSMASQDLVLPENEDAGEEDAGEPPQKQKRRRRRVRRPQHCNGQLDPKAAQAVMQENRRRVRKCYERQLKMKSNLAGRVIVKLRLNAAGQVTDVGVGGTLRDKKVVSCVRTLAKRWEFPPLEKGRCAVLQAPFSFTPKE